MDNDSGIIFGAREGGLATPPSRSAPRLRAMSVIIMTGVWLRRVAGGRGHEHRQRNRLRFRGAAVSRPLPAGRPHACVHRASSSRQHCAVMDNDSGIIFGAGGRRSRDPSLLLSPTCSRVRRHHDGRLAAASGGTSSSWTMTMASTSGPGGRWSRDPSLVVIPTIVRRALSRSAAVAAAQREPTLTAEVPQISEARGHQFRARRRCAGLWCITSNSHGELGPQYRTAEMPPQYRTAEMPPNIERQRCHQGRSAAMPPPSIGSDTTGIDEAPAC
jgi:hypothetical protein